MFFGRAIGNSIRSGWIAILLLAAVAAVPGSALAQSINCSDAPYNGLIDGDVYPSLPSQITIDGDCTIRRLPGVQSALDATSASIARPLPVGSSSSTTSCTRARWRATAVAGHKIWFVNGSSTYIKDHCHDLLIPVEKIDKASPGAAATVGVPFTYTLTMPILFDPRRHRDQRCGVRERPSRHHALGRPQRDGRESHVREPRRPFEGKRLRPCSTRSRTLADSSRSIISSDRSGRATDRRRSHCRARQHTVERARHAVHQYRRNGTSAGSSTAFSTSRCPASGASAPMTIGAPDLKSRRPVQRPWPHVELGRVGAIRLDVRNAGLTRLGTSRFSIASRTSRRAACAR